MRLERYLVEGVGDTSGATDMEKAIELVWKGEPLTGKFEKHGEIAENIKTFLQANGITGDIQHMGSGGGALSKNWHQYGGTDNTPKTDIKIGKHNISLKKMGPSQLMSGKKGETKATFYSVADDIDMDINNLIIGIESYLNKMITGYSDKSITAQKNSGEEAIDFTQAEKTHKVFEKQIKDAFKNDVFHNGVVKEAMTGKLKFKKGEDAIATHLLVFDGETGEKNKWSTINDRYVNTVASKTKVNIGWKSSGWDTKSTETGRKYSFFSVLRLANTNIKEEFDKLDGEMITEGVISNIKTKIKKWFSVLWKKIKSWLSLSVVNVLSFFNLEGDLTFGLTNF